MADVTTVDIPGYGPVDFPNSMSPADMTAAAKRLHAQAAYNSPEGQQQSAQADADVKRYRSLGVPTDDLGKPTRPVTFGERANDAILHPTPGMQLAADVAGAGALSLGSPVQSMVGDAVRGAARGTLRMVSKLPVDAVDADLVSIFSPRGGATLRKMQQVKTALSKPPVPDVAPPVAAPATAAAETGLSAVDRAALVKQGYTPEIIAKIEAQLAPVASHAPTPAPVEPIAPVASHPLTPTEEPIPAPMQAARRDIGAEDVARNQGMSKQAVRDQTVPLYGENPGEAAPVFPETDYQRMAGKLRAMHPNPGDPAGDAAAWAARLGYANKAGDPKTLSQLVTIMRVLRDSHLAIPAAVAGGMALRGRMTRGDAQ